MRQPLTAETAALLRRELERACGAGTLLAFAEAVVQQVVYPVGGRSAGPEREQQVATLLLEVILAACRGGASEDDIALLAAHPALLSACFQNADLLRASAGDVDGRRAGDLVATLVLAGVDKVRG